MIVVVVRNTPLVWSTAAAALDGMTLTAGTIFLAGKVWPWLGPGFLAGYLVYLAIAPARWGGTLFQHLMRVRVVAVEGGRPPLRRALRRFAFQLIEGVALACTGPVAMIVLSLKRVRANDTHWHDLKAGTRLVFAADRRAR